MPFQISIQLKRVILKCDRCYTWKVNGIKKVLGTKSNNELLTIHKK